VKYRIIGATSANKKSGFGCNPELINPEFGFILVQLHQVIAAFWYFFSNRIRQMRIRLRTFGTAAVMLD
tara:strand:+ start:75 stop:281 length:207 start_codon:yes stop_codon:yes gene_type:complete